MIIDDPEDEIQETYDDYGDYEAAGPSGEGVTDETKGRHVFFVNSNMLCHSVKIT